MEGALDFLGDKSFDAIHTKAFLNGVPSPRLKDILSKRNDTQASGATTAAIERIKTEIAKQSARLLKDDGFIIEFEGL